MSTDHVTIGLMNDVMDELRHARTKFPGNNVWVTLAALTEEVGELNKAILEINQEPEKGVTERNIREEAIQVIAMAIRVAIDCNHLDYRRE